MPVTDFGAQRRRINSLERAEVPQPRSSHRARGGRIEPGEKVFADRAAPRPMKRS